MWQEVTSYTPNFSLSFALQIEFKVQDFFCLGLYGIV